MWIFSSDACTKENSKKTQILTNSPTQAHPNEEANQTEKKLPHADFH